MRDRPAFLDLRSVAETRLRGGRELGRRVLAAGRLLVLGQPPLQDAAREDADQTPVAVDDGNALGVVLLEEPERLLERDVGADRGARRRPARTHLLPGAPGGTPSPRERRSRIDAPRLERGRDLADPRGERRRPETDVALLGEVPDAVEGGRELLGELRPDLVARPEDAPEILDPLEVRDGHAAGIREDVGKDRNAALGEDRVRSDRRGPVRTLGDHPRPKTRRVVGMHLILAGGEHEDVAVELEQLLVGHALAVVTADERTLLADVLLQRRNVEAGLRA